MTGLPLLGAVRLFGDWSAGAAAWQLTALAMKTTLLLGLGAAAAPLAGRRSAAARHLVWGATLTGVLALPVLRAAGARWTPRTFTEWAGSVEAVVAAPRSPERSHAVASRVPTVTPDVRPAGGRAPELVGGGLLLIWGAGVAFGLAAVVRGAAARRTLARRTPPGAAGAVDGALGQLAAQLGVRRPPRLVWGPAGTMPMTWGVRRPVVLLPADAAAWPAADREAVLRHELAHVRRGDAAWTLVAELAAAVFWFHPGVWWARAARLRWQERAADALAVAGGAERHAYAAALVRAARSLARAPRPAGWMPTSTPAFALHVGLAERLRVLTAPGFASPPCTARRRTAILAGTAAGTLALAALGRAAAMPNVAPHAARTGARGPAALAPEPDPAAFVAADSTLVVLVPSTADAAGLRGGVRTLGPLDVTAVYTTDDLGARRAADELHARVGGSLINYDRVGMTDDAFAAVLVANAVGANPRRAVAVVVEPALVRPFLRRAAAAAGVDAGPDGNVGGRANGVTVLTVGPRPAALVRARY